MREDFIKAFGYGFHCNSGAFYLDPKKPVEMAVITHAHADHAVAGHRIVYCTPVTRKLMEERYGLNCAGRFFEKSFGEPFNINGITVTFYPAGHILGSAQVLMESEEVKYLYTGDFKLQEDQTCEAFQHVETDVLYTESTFGNKDVSHPSALEQLKNILAPERNQNVMIGAYTLGKAQRITAMLGQHFPERPLMVHPAIARYHRIYEFERVSLGEWAPYNRSNLEKQKDCIYLVPPSIYARYQNNPFFIKAFATGWANYHLKSDVPLRISDHADWEDLLVLISRSKARRIFTLHGDGSELVKHFSGSKIKVTELR